MTMNNILMVQTSLNGDSSTSNQLATKLAEGLTEQVSSASDKITIRDLVSKPLPHLSQSEMASWMIAPEQRTPQQAEQANLSELLIEELQSSDTLIIGMPLYNFGVPSTFKAWIDRIARAGITFRYTENGPEGLLGGKKVYIVATRGGMYQGTAKDSQTQYLTDVFAFLGLSDIHFIYAEGLNMPGGDERLQLATDEINRISEINL